MHFQIQVVVPHAHAAVPGMRAAARFPVVMPEYGAIARIHCPRVIWRGHVEDSIHHQNAAAQARRAACVEISLA